MPEKSPFKQVDEKHVSAEVTCMRWSPKMDLIVVANVQAEVILYRLSWQKVWTLPAPCEHCKVTCLAWRTDGKVVAVGYDTGQMQLCDVENASCLHSVTLSGAITAICWVSGAMLEGGGTEADDTTEDVFQDMSSHYLPRLPAFSKGINKGCFMGREDNVEDSKRLKGQKDLNILVTGTAAGRVSLYAYGVFPVGEVDLSRHGIGKSGHILHASLSEDLYLLSLLLQTHREDAGSRDVYLMSFDTTLLASRHKQLQTLALKFGQLLSLMTYLHTTIEQMQEAWEDILLEMDSKLQKFAEEKNKVCGGSVSNDFLQLLMFGIPSDELQVFLLHDLTEKGLKKLGHSIETSYSNIQKLVLKHLHSVGLAIVYHLEDIRGMSLWYDKFGVLGLSTATVQQAVAVAGSFMLKASELQQVIDGSMKNLKAFFWWLYVVIQQLSDEPVPPELSKMTEQDLNFVAHFLKENFTEELDGRQSGFKLEKVGQYLKNEELHDPPDGSTNPWVDFLEHNPKLQESSLLYRACPTKSLVQMHDSLKKSVDVTVQHSAAVVGQSLQCVSTSHLFTLPHSESERTSPNPDSHNSAGSMTVKCTCTRPSPVTLYLVRNFTSFDRRSQETGHWS
ncbi:hypothetical protein NP493_1295g01027 [Ridgeia piscesae]|uniref:Anaphase-promoting complex subunit 4 n=1 Tax=Ridgeia piscesae TaxID=27915 RepID=A0AAD9NE52_RIDPI|nr:hypothetical protein NP493_1295g01027 [Ridgeia piscesae]